MPKSKEQRYKEAVERNITNAQRSGKYRNTKLDIDTIAIKLGIRRNDLNSLGKMMQTLF